MLTVASRRYLENAFRRQTVMNGAATTHTEKPVVDTDSPGQSIATGRLPAPPKASTVEDSKSGLQSAWYFGKWVWRYERRGGGDSGNCDVMSLNMSGARAGVTIGGTRVLSEGGANEVTVQLGNDGNVPAWVQVWLD